MNIKLMAYKCGMTRFFTKDGLSIPVTIIKVYSNYIVGIRHLENDCFLIKLAANPTKKRINKSIESFFKKNNIPNFKYIFEFKIKNIKNDEYSIGDKFSVSIFKISDEINISGISKGKGFTGVIKRHNFRLQRASHGNSLSHRAPGSIGQCQTPGRVFKGKKMSGNMGNKKVTILNNEIVEIYNDLDVIVLKGSVPGPIGSKLILEKKNLNS